ncbi:CUE domain-containing protein 2-A-like [Babylonia areolata]|uniref:CUE domain-containing protein 2-A-like n=1 Tax=Babylonia areolata TaxID=304850 RepID=UPI003FCF3DFB
MELNEKESVVRQELKYFLVQHSLPETGSADDEIVLNYILGVLECLPPGDDLDDTEDVEPFAETVEAYLPGFSAISAHDVGEWMLNTAMKLSQPQQSDASRTLEQPVEHPVQDGEKSCSSRSSGEALDRIVQIDTKGSSSIENELQSPKSSLHREAGACGEKRTVHVVQSADSDSISALRELCPAASTAELQHCLYMCGGNVEEAACLLLYRQESGTAITKKLETKARKKNSKTGCDLHNDESLKDSILAKYSFVDTSEDKTEHKPELFQKEQKKMIRYREGQVVSTKGERFSEIKKQESEELKKTYVNLKPQRKYRFH